MGTTTLDAANEIVSWNYNRLFVHLSSQWPQQVVISIGCMKRPPLQSRGAMNSSSNAVRSRSAQVPPGAQSCLHECACQKSAYGYTCTNARAVAQWRRAFAFPCRYALISVPLSISRRCASTGASPLCSIKREHHRLNELYTQRVVVRAGYATRGRSTAAARDARAGGTPCPVNIYRHHDARDA